MKTVLVLGAAGSVGRAVATAFVAHGWQVLGLVRAGRAGDLPQGVQPVAADLYAPAAVAAACEAAAPGGVDIVFNGLNLPYSRWAAEASGLYSAALDVAGALGARHIYPGNIYVFGAGMPAQLRTDTPFRPTTRKGKIRVDIEAGMRQAAEAGRVRSVVIRAGDFFGAASKTSWMELLVAKNLARGELTGVGPRDTVHAWAYLPDLAETIVRLSEVEAKLPAFDVFHFPGHNITLDELKASAEAATGREVRLGSMPRLAFGLMALFDPQVREALEMLYLWDVPHALIDERLSSVIGPVPHTPLPEALRSRK